jgi:hypothetical protein
MINTTIYDSEGNVLETSNEEFLSNFWRSGQNIAGYVEIGTCVTAIGNNAFSNNHLTSVIIPNSITVIESATFYNNLLTSVTIPDSVTSIEDAAFQSNQLTSVTIGNSVTDIGGYAFSYNQLTEVTIPNSVTNIESYAFSNNQLTSVTIGNSVTSIGNYAFLFNQLTSVTIPNSVTSIGNYAFSFNQLLNTVNCNVPQSAFGSNAFGGTASPLTIHARVDDDSWTEGTGLSFQGNDNVTVIKDLGQGGGGGGIKNGWITDTYWINDVATSLDQSGNGTWVGKLYENGSLFSGTKYELTFVDGVAQPVQVVTVTGNDVPVAFGLNEAEEPLVKLVFASITSAGETTVEQIVPTVIPAGIPAQYTVAQTVLAYSIDTTATFEGTINVDFILPSNTSQAVFDRVKCFHVKNNGTAEETSRVSSDFATKKITVAITSFSSFLFMDEPQQTGGKLVKIQGKSKFYGKVKFGV